MRRAFAAVRRWPWAGLGLPPGLRPLIAVLASDADPEVRQMAAFALGLIGDAKRRRRADRRARRPRSVGAGTCG